MTLMDAARNAVALAKPKKGEKLLVVTDQPTIEIGLAIYLAAAGKCKAELVTIKPTGRHGKEPPATVAKAMRKCDIYFCPTMFSLSHTKARRDAKKAGARGATLPGITKDCFVRTMGADYKQVKRDAERIWAKMGKATNARVVAEGTDIEFAIKGRKKCVDDGDISRRGSFNNLPAGEAGTAPIEGKSNGHFTARDYNVGGRRTRFTVENGKVTAVSGNPELKKQVFAIKNATNIAEFSIGANPRAKVGKLVLEAEKARGTCHIAIGNSLSMGGNIDAPVHWDFVIESPTIWFDGKKFMQRGRML